MPQEAPEVRVEEQAEGEGASLVRGIGPLGTGVHLLRYAERSEQRIVADAWITLAFVPVLPLGAWSFVSEGPGMPWRLTALEAPKPLPAVATFLLFVLAVAAALVPGALALTVLMGNRLLELAGALGSVALLVMLVAWLDETARRLPLRVALSVLSGRRPLERVPSGPGGPRLAH